MYKAIIFDFFGVIYSDPANRWFQKHSIARSGEYEDLFKQVDRGYITLDQAFEQLERLSGQPVDEIKSVFGQTDMIDHEVVDIIRHLKKTHQVGLLSNASSGYLRKILAENELDILFDEIIISSEVGVIKPDPEIFQIMLDRMNVEPSSSIFIDDMESNVSSAQQLKIRGVIFTDAASLRSKLSSIAVL